MYAAIITRMEHDEIGEPLCALTEKVTVGESHEKLNDWGVRTVAAMNRGINHRFDYYVLEILEADKVV